MTPWTVKRTIELTKWQRNAEYLGLLAYTDNAKGHRLILEVMNEKEAVSFDDYIVTAKFLPNESKPKQQIVIAGVIVGNTVTVDFPAEAYQEGRTGVVVCAEKSGEQIPLYGAVFTVRNGSADKTVDPADIVLNLAELLAQINAVKVATKDGLAAAQEARDAAEEAVQTAEAAGTQAVSLAQAAGVQAISNANTAGAEAKATAETAAAKADAAREAIEGDLGAIEAAILTKAPAIECEASGSILTIPDAAAQPAVQLISHIVPVQAGSGDPSPENVRPISGWNAVTVKRTGKNLVNTSHGATYNGVSINASGGVAVWNGQSTKNSGSNSNALARITLKPGTYTVSHSVLANNSIGVYDGMSVIMVNTDEKALTSTKIGSPSSTFMLNRETTVNIRAYITDSRVTYDNFSVAVQLEKGSVATEFEPPAIQTLSADLPGTVYGGSLDWKTGTLTVEPYDLATFDGSEDFQIPASHTNTVTQVFTCVEVKVSNKASFTSTRSKSRSNMFRPIVQSDYAGLRENTFYWVDATGAWRFGWGAPGATVEEFKAFLQANPLQILVPTTEGTKEYQLTPQQLDMLKGLNNVWSDCGDTSLVYVADTKMYIDGKISELVTLALAKN